jgi:hypothetical protein
MKDIKGSSSYIMNNILSSKETFKWQEGYGAFSISRDDIPRVRSYIQNQKEQHRKGILEEYLEYR